MRGWVPESPRVCRPGWRWGLTKPRAVGVDGEGQVGRWRAGSGAAGLPLRPLAAAGRVAGHGGVLRQAVPREVVVLGLPGRWIPPGACAPLCLRLLEAPASPAVDAVHLRGVEERTVERPTYLGSRRGFS